MGTKQQKNNWMRSSAFVWKNEKKHDCYSIWIYAFGKISLYEQTAAIYNRIITDSLTEEEALTFLKNIEDENIKDPSKYKLPEIKTTEAPYKHMLPTRFFDTPHFQSSDVYMKQLIGPTTKSIPLKKARFKK